ncbi:MAG TPA: hypothetical protein VG325_07665 [Solirubrobacteraceae bacterium]|jgi:hypothetical protein|nr:hypothetical protein [Solirubrobacteraceae bacterium]
MSFFAQAGVPPDQAILHAWLGSSLSSLPTAANTAPAQRIWVRWPLVMPAPALPVRQPSATAAYCSRESITS